jgi:uncharacterized damage-inducible protein DinB
MDARQLLVETHSHLPPAATLAAITPADAARHVAGLPHSIAEIVAHLTYWQEWFIARSEGRAEAMAATASLGWPAVDEAAWPALAERFVAGLDRLADVVSQHDPDARIAPAIEFPMLAEYSFRDVWEHVAQHNAHHLGQVVVLRQLLGIWPPPSGSYTW